MSKPPEYATTIFFIGGKTKAHPPGKTNADADRNTVGAGKGDWAIVMGRQRPRRISHQGANRARKNWRPGGVAGSTGPVHVVVDPCEGKAGFTTVHGALIVAEDSMM